MLGAAHLLLRVRHLVGWPRLFLFARPFLLPALGLALLAGIAVSTLGVGLLYLSPGQGDIGAQATLGSVAIYELRAIESVRNNPNISPFDELAAIENIQKEFAGLKSTPGLGNLTRQDGQGIAAVSMVVNLVAFATMVFAAKQRYQASGSHSRSSTAHAASLMKTNAGGQPRAARPPTSCRREASSYCSAREPLPRELAHTTSCGAPPPCECGAPGCDRREGASVRCVLGSDQQP